MEETQPMSLGRRLQRERESHHWTQQQLAEKIGGSVPSINRWENDRAVPRKDMLHLLSEAFGRAPEGWGTARALLWDVPFLRNPYFTGRDLTLQRLHRALGTDQTVLLSQARAISGLGGIGKTQTAIEYAYRYANEYEAVLWVRADSHETLIADFASLAITLDLQEKGEHDQFLVITAVKRWLQDHGPWLLIFDNADELAVVSDFLPRRAGGSILLTTRSQITGPHMKKIAMEKMSQEEGIIFLLRRICAGGDEDGEESLSTCVSDAEQLAAQELWEAMDGLPLALDQAGAYIEAKQSSLSEYLRLYRNHRELLLRERGGTIPEHPDSVATTWAISFQRVKQKNPAAAELLQFCAFLSPDAIPEELITQGAAHLSPALQTLATSALALNEAISILGSYSLIKRDPATHMLSMHRLVQLVLRDTLEETERLSWVKWVVQAVNAAFPHLEHETRTHCDRLLSQVLLATHYIEQAQIISEEAGRLLYETALYLHTYARYSESEPLYQRALTMREQLLEPQHLDVAEAIYGLGTLYNDQGKYVEAEPFYQRALAIREQQLGSHHSVVAASLNGLAFLYTNQGKYSNQDNYAEAERLYQRALRIYEEAEHPDIAMPLNNLAKLYYDQGNYAEAEPLYQRALHIFEQNLGPEHPRTAMPLNNLAGIYCMQGRYEEGEPFFRRALRTWELQLGPMHPLVAASLGNLAELACLQGKHAEAEPLYLRALHIYEQALGPQHPETAEAMDDLARLQKAQGNGEEAAAWYARALTAREQVLGKGHAKSMETRDHLITLLQAMGKHEEAAQLQTVQDELGTHKEELPIKQ